MTDRVGQKLRVVSVGTMNTAMVEFDDGHRCITSRFGYHRSRIDAAHRMETTLEPVARRAGVSRA